MDGRCWGVERQEAMPQPAGQKAREECNERWQCDKRWRRRWTGDVGVTRGNATTSWRILMREAIGNESSSSCAAMKQATNKKGLKTRLSSQREVAAQWLTWWRQLHSGGDSSNEDNNANMTATQKQ